MRPGKSLQNKIFSSTELERKIVKWKFLKKTIVFTNGCFDLLHAGHIASLTEAAQHGDILLVALNSDRSTRILKGEARPVNSEQDRAAVLAALAMVDAVTIFDEETPLELILKVQPDVMVKGGDYTIDQIAGAKEIVAAGGKVITNPIVPGLSSSSIINKIQNL